MSDEVIKVEAHRVPVPIRPPETPLFDDLVTALGHNPLDHSDHSWDDYNLANQYHRESMREFRALTCP